MIEPYAGEVFSSVVLLLYGLLRLINTVAIIVGAGGAGGVGDGVGVGVGVGV